jgi:hypothetical protein
MAWLDVERSMRLNEIVREFERFGAVKTLQDLALRGLNLFLPAKILKGVRIDTVHAEFLKCEPPYHGEFLSEALLTEIIRNRPEYEMSESFLRQSFAKGDECYGFLDGSVLAAYGWYSNRPTAIDAPGMVLHFDGRYIYMYKGFTHVKYRGQRLHAIAMTRALEVYQARGYKGFLAYVEWNNFGSLKSCYRMGYADFGNIYLARLFGHYLTHADRGCTPYGFRLEYAGTGGPTERRLHTARPSAPTE